MILPALVLAATVVSLPAGIWTYPEIAAKMGDASMPVKCDSAARHRAAFAQVKGMDREALASALGMKLVPEGKRMLLKSEETVQERRWFAAIQGSLERDGQKFLREAVTYADSGAPKEKVDGSAWEKPFSDVMSDPKATTKGRLVAAEKLISARTRRIVATAFGEAAVRTAADISDECPASTFETGEDVRVVSLRSLSPATVAAIRRALPGVTGAPGAIAVRRLVVGRSGGLISVAAEVGIVDAGTTASLGYLPPAMWPKILPIGSAPSSLTASVVFGDAEGLTKMRGFGAVLAERRTEETAAREMIARYCREAPVANLTSLSQEVEAWAKKGHDVVMELSPDAESAAVNCDAEGVKKDADWSPIMSGDVLVLRPLLRFLDARRRYSFEALRALEAAPGAFPPKGREARGPYIGPPEIGPAVAYAALSSPGTKWGDGEYRMWRGYLLDQTASEVRIGNMAPPEALAAISGGAPSWTSELAKLPKETAEQAAAEMRATWIEGHCDFIAWSPEAFEAFWRTGRMQVERGQDRLFVSITNDQRKFGDAELYGWHPFP